MKLSAKILAGIAMLLVIAPAVHAQVRSANRICLFERPAGPAMPRLCIRKSSYASDLCRALEHFATVNGLPPDYFARLIWRESLFRADAVSPKGAEGIAQFMPGTARMRGLENSFDVLQALDASAAYLRDLRDQFGNLGFAAAAYNAGEAGLARFLNNGSLPLETRDYVFAITGQPVETWQDDPQSVSAQPLDPALSFHSACVRLAISRDLREPILLGSADWAPWGVQLAASFNPSVTMRLLSISLSRLPAPLNSEHALIIRQKRVNPGMRKKYQARIGRETRNEAIELCDAIHRSGVACAVVKN